MAALLYEVAWTRLLGLHLGHTTAAASTVLASYMAGLAVGSFVAGRVGVTLPRTSALRFYAALEAGVAAWALLLPWLLGALEPVLRVAYGTEGGALFGVTRVAASFVLVTLPATAMGATFPLATRWLVRDPARAGSDVGALYALNTAGAAVGAATAGFVLLPALGVARTTAVGVVLSLVAASAAWFIARQPEESDKQTELRHSRPVGSGTKAGRRGKAAPQRPAPGPRVAPAARPGVAAAAVAVSGFVALVHEVAWTRVLVMVLGPTGAAFSAMLVAFIGGLAIGSALGAWLARATERPVFWLSIALGLVAAGGGAVSLALNHLPLRVAEASIAAGASFESVFLTNAAVAALLLLPLTAALGAAFPLALAAATGSVERAPREAGSVYAANSAAAIAGSLLAGFVFIERLGLRGTVTLAAALACGGAVLVALVGLPRLRPRLISASVAIAGFAFVALGPRWDVELLAGGAYKYAPFVAGLDLESALKAGELLFHEDSGAGTVTVRRTAGITALAIDGKVDASNGGDMLTQKLLGHLPLLLHDAPKDVCVIGLGSGVTAGAVLQHQVERVEVVEISRPVVHASEFFRAENDGALTDPRLRLIVGDGRTHLALAARTYDVVISEPSNPWMSGMAGLFTREFFATVRRRLRPGGLFCQWAHAYDMSDADLRSIVATFVEVFPHASLWLSGESDVLLVGSEAEIDERLSSIPARFAAPAVKADLEGVDVHDAFSLLSLHVAGSDGLRRYGAGAQVQTDDRLALEHTAPRALFANAGPENLERLLALSDTARPAFLVAAADGATADHWWNRGRMLEKAEGRDLAYASYRLAVQKDPRHAGALEGLVRMAPGAGRTREAVAVFREVLRVDPGGLPGRLALSRLLAADGDLEEAVRLAREARGLAPGTPEPLELLASLFADQGDVSSLQAIVEELQAKHPSRASTPYYAANARFLIGDLEGASRLAQAAVALDPRHAKSWTVAGAALASLGRLDQARAAFRKSVSLDRSEVSAFANLALLELNAGNAVLATRLFAEALTVDPRHPTALAGLAEALDRQGFRQRAEKVRRQASPGAPDQR